jgi:hypothetical protein
VQLRPRLEGVDRLVGADERVLHGVLRVLVVAEEPARHREQPAAVRAHDGLERRVVAALQPGDELGV